VGQARQSAKDGVPILFWSIQSLSILFNMYLILPSCGGVTSLRGIISPVLAEKPHIEGAGGGGLSVAVVGVGVLQAVVYLLFVRAIDLYEREELKYVIPVFVWGFTVAALFSLVFNTIIGTTLSIIANDQAASFLTAVFVAPPVEEIFKGTALLIAFVIASLVARRKGAMEFSGVMDGIVYGSAVGFGFSLAEDIIYYAQAGQETFVVRRIFGGFAHAAFTSLTGIGLGLVPWVRSKVLKVFLPVMGLSGAILLHASFNLTASLFGPLAYLLQLLVIILYVVAIVAWLAVERRTIRSELYEEMRAGTISARDYDILPTYFARTIYYLGLIFTGRFGEWRRARKRHEAAVNLAFIKRVNRQTYSASQQMKMDLLRRRISEFGGGRALGFGS
jgi:RsiW-degrading membrane proteinase PrsW (M82 family)